MRDDRPVCDQCEIRRKRPLVHFGCRRFLNVLIMVLGDWVVQIPMAALAGVMIMVSIGTFDWSSFSMLRKVPLTDSIVMLVTVITVVATHDLSKGVFAGVILSAIFFVAKFLN